MPTYTNLPTGTQNLSTARAKVEMRTSWALVHDARTKGIRRSFDPDAAGRRAVRKHGEALRRLSD